MKFKKLIAAGLTAAVFLTAGIGVSAAGSTKVTRTANVGYSQGSDDFQIVNGELRKYKGSSSNVVIPSGVTSIEYGAFIEFDDLDEPLPNNTITSITIPDTVTTIEGCAFEYCYALKKVTFGKSVKKIKSCAFGYCKSLTSLNLPNSVTYIGGGAFLNCSELTTIYIPESVTYIADDNNCDEFDSYGIYEGAFKGCESLMDIYYTGTKDKWDKLAKDLKLNSYTTVHCATELKVLTHPSNVTVQPGKNVSFTVKAQGDGLKYQWYYMKAGAPSWSQWGSRTTATTTATSNESWDGMRVYCKVTDKYGKAVKSNPATITVTQELKITKQPVGATVRTGDTVTLSLKAEGLGLSYQWYFKKAGQTAWNVWKGHTGATETAAAPSSWDGIQFYCKVSDKNGNEINSNTVKITLSDVLSITQQPANQTAALGSAVTLSLKAKGEGVTYQWYYKKTTQTSWNVWSGRTHASETVTPNATWNGIQLYCKVSDKSGNSIDSAKIKIILSGVITVTQQPTDKTIALGKSVTLSLKAEGDSLSYQWYFKKAGQSSFSAWSGRTHDSETCTPNATWNGIQLYCLIKDSTGKSVKSNTVKVTVTGEEIKITTQPVNKSVKLGNSVTVSLSAQGSGLSYQWYYKKSGQSSFSAWNGCTHASETCKPNETWNDIQLYCLVKDAFGKSVKSNTIKITVTGIELKILTQPVGETVRLGFDYTISLKAQGVGLTYQWYYKKEGQSSFTAWKGRTHASETVTLTESWDGIQLYCIVKDSSGKSIKSDTITFYVEDESQELQPGEYNCFWYKSGDSEYGEDIFDTANSIGYFIELFIYSDNTAALVTYSDYSVDNSIDYWIEDGQIVSDNDTFVYYYSEGILYLYGWSDGEYCEFAFNPVEYYIQ